MEVKEIVMLCRNSYAYITFNNGKDKWSDMYTILGFHGTVSKYWKAETKMFQLRT
jgi:hypothetical protein